MGLGLLDQEMAWLYWREVNRSMGQATFPSPHSAFDGWAWVELWRNMTELGVRYQYHEKG
jgi:hypothetical protein